MAYTLTAKLTLTDSGPTYSASTSTPLTMTLNYTNSFSQMIEGATYPVTVDISGTMAAPKFVLVRAVTGSGTVVLDDGDATNPSVAIAIDSTGGWVMIANAASGGQDIDTLVIDESSNLVAEVIAYS